MLGVVLMVAVEAHGSGVINSAHKGFMGGSVCKWKERNLVK